MKFETVITIGPNNQENITAPKISSSSAFSFQKYFSEITNSKDNITDVIKNTKVIGLGDFAYKTLLTQVKISQ